MSLVKSLDEFDEMCRQIRINNKSKIQTKYKWNEGFALESFTKHM